MIDKALSNQGLNFDRLEFIVRNSISFQLDKNPIIAFLIYQLYKIDETAGKELIGKVSKDVGAIVEDFITIKDINNLTPSENIEDVKRMFIVMSRDIRVVIMKLFGIAYDISVLRLPLSENDSILLKQVKEIHVPLSERLGLDKLKLLLNDNVIRLEHPSEYKKLVDEIKNKQKENQRQLELSKRKIQDLLKELNIN